MEDISTPYKFFLNRDDVQQAVESFKTEKTMNVVIKMLGVEPVPAQVVPPLPSTEANMELALVSYDQTEVVPVAVEDAPALGSNSEVAILRTMVSSNRSSPAEEVEGGLKQKNSRLSQESTTTASRTIGKKRLLVKESKLMSL